MALNYTCAIRLLEVAIAILASLACSTSAFPLRQTRQAAPDELQVQAMRNSLLILQAAAMPNPMLSFQHQMELIDACQVLAYTRVILKGNGSQEENTDKNQSSIIGAAEMIQNATCTWLNEVTGELLFTCTANEVKAFCNQVNIYHSTQAVLNWLIGPINDPCTWISDHFAAERDTEIRQFLLQRTDCSV